MSSFFSIDSPFYKFMNRLLDMLKLNVMWLLCSGVAAKFIIEGIIVLAGFGSYRVFSWIPLLLIGPATTAAFSITLRMVDEEEGYIAKPFLKAYRENFKDGMILGVITLIAVYALYLDFQLYNNVKDSNIMFLIVFVLGLFLLFTHYVYSYALMGRYENTVVNTLKNSFTISLRYFKKTILIFLVVAFEILLFMWSGTTQFIGIIIGPVCVILTISGMAKPIFLQIERDNNGEESDDEEAEADLSDYENIDYEKLAKKAEENKK